jgi:hypothetical protein
MAHKYEEYNKKYYQEHRVAIIEKKKKSNKEFRERFPEKHLVKAAKQRAKNKGWEFNLTHEDINIPKYCPYLGIELKYLGGDSSPSLDRIDSSKGYIKGNVQVISTKANTMKSNASKDELITFSKAILRMFEVKLEDL